MEYLFIYIENTKLDEVLKYGMKLSEFSNKILIIGDTTKNGIIAYLTPKDSELYYNPNYTCLRIKNNNINCIIYNKICENTDYLEDFIIDSTNYIYGNYEEPVALIQSCILPENIFVFNKLIDVPILIEESKNFYYEKKIGDMINSGLFNNYELYQILLILGNQKNIFDIKENTKGLRIYEDKKSGTLYTKKGK